MTPEAQARFHRITKPWRIVFFLYLLALTISTHWPNFELPDSVPVKDTTLHLLGFGGLTFLLWQTQWLKSRWIVALIVAGWSCLDEYSQGIPILHRWVTWQDAVANVLGVIVVAIWLWALRPIGQTPNRVRLAYHRFIWEEMSSQWKVWIVTGIGGVVIGISVFWFSMWKSNSDYGWSVFCTSMMCGFAFILIWIYFGQREFISWLQERPCFVCGNECPEELIEKTGVCPCPKCGQTLRATQWLRRAFPEGHQFRKVVVKPLLWALFVLYVGVMSFLLFMFLIRVESVFFPLLESTVQWIVRLPESVTDTIDISLFLVLFAFVVYTYRKQLAKYFDRSWRCRNCDYDLRGTPVSPAGVGTCAECGTMFLREVDDTRKEATSPPLRS